MAKPLLLTGRIELLAHIYSGDILPSAIVCVKGKHAAPWCVHGFREGDEALFEEQFMQRARPEYGYAETDKSHDEELQFELFKFFEDFPKQGAECHSCYFNNEKGKGERHKINQSDVACTKTTDECA